MSSDATWRDPVSHLRQALAGEEFTLYCQPIIALAEPTPYPMAEVLVRLQEEEMALRPPGEFLPLLEHYGMMPELDRWVVRRTLQRISNGTRIARFCINLSGQTLADRAFPAFFADALHAMDLEGDCILFEIEESDAFALPECIGRFSATVGSLGAGVVIDGFGRVPDPFAALQVPCIEFIKLHSGLTRRLVGGKPTADEKELLHAAREVGIGTIAECVDHRDELMQLKSMKIDYAQGFGICLPRPIDAFTEARAQAA